MTAGCDTPAGFDDPGAIDHGTRCRVPSNPRNKDESCAAVETSVVRILAAGPLGEDDKGRELNRDPMLAVRTARAPDLPNAVARSGGATTDGTFEGESGGDTAVCRSHPPRVFLIICSVSPQRNDVTVTTTFSVI